MMDEDRIVKIAINGYWRDASPKAREDARWHLVCALTALHEAGLAVVPVEPTEAMLDAASQTFDWAATGRENRRYAYRAMIRAAAKADPQ